MSENKPCPFCGSDEIYSEQLDISRWHVICENCGARLYNYTSEKDGYKQWNIRPVEDELQAKNPTVEKREMTNWTSITEELPDDGEIVLVDDGITETLATFERQNLIDYAFIENEHFIIEDVYRWQRI